MDYTHDSIIPPTQPQYISTFANKTQLMQKITQAWRYPESECVSTLLAQSTIPEAMQLEIRQVASDLSQQLRQTHTHLAKTGIVQGLLQEFSLSSQEGIALMCLAEALLRIPDQATRHILIRDKIHQGNWKKHLGHSQLIFVNAAAWGLMLTGKLLQTPQTHSLSSLLTRLIARSGRGMIAKAVDVAIRMLGEQFVTGENIVTALKNAEPLQQKGFCYSYDMLGEAAITAQDAERYYQDYSNAIHAIGQASIQHDVYHGPGISIKLSALHPRYQRSQIARVHRELYPKLLKLAVLAHSYNIGFNIDAEETERLEISLELFERLCFEPDLSGWKGLGFVIQAYQKRCNAVVDYLIDLAQRSQKRLMIRLVKGAYWDSEIKKAQIEGAEDFPVFTRKVHTDLSYIACAEKLLAAPQYIYPQFATHNAQTLATIYHLAGAEQYYPGQYEFQCLHGMGESLYQHVVGSRKKGKLGIPCRIYAPVGHHETLLAYLVRRLLENGANSSFVHRIADPNIAIETLIQDPHTEILQAAQREQSVGQAHLHIAAPRQLYAPDRLNALGFDLSNDHDLAALNQAAIHFKIQQWNAAPMGEQLDTFQTDQAQLILNPANHHDVVGNVLQAQPVHIEHALSNACDAQATWARQSKATRAAYLIRASDLLESHRLEAMVLLCRESGKNYANALAEIREAVDFMRYYAAQIQSLKTDTQIEPLGPVLCISPWNFPLAIFLGQISAALLAGNCVIAKPAEQTPLIAAFAIHLLWQAGIPTKVVQMLPGDGEAVAGKLSQDARIQAIMFTGSTDVAKILQRTLSKRLNQFGQPVTFIAETGGQNAMIVDSSALSEQVVIDIIQSAFDSAGQRCSALRLLCLQDDQAETVLSMLKGAMQQLTLGQPYRLDTDIGPVIDAPAQQQINQHIQRLKQQGCAVYQLDQQIEQLNLEGTFVPPTLIELSDISELQQEIFGPVLHVIRYQHGQIPDLITAINAKAYGLTMGLHTRIDEHIDVVMQHAHVGNLYINRNMVGAVVGVQPFGGEGLSGTGPKAGGPLYLYRLMQHCSHKPLDSPYAARPLSLDLPTPAALQIFKQWQMQYAPSVQPATDAATMIRQQFELTGPTGERNLYRIAPRQGILCLAEQTDDLMRQLATVFSLGSQVVLCSKQHSASTLIQHFPAELLPYIHVIDDLQHGAFDLVIHHGEGQALLHLQQQLALRPGGIIQIVHLPTADSTIPLERLIIERVISINTAAAGGNTSLMTLSEY